MRVTLKSDIFFEALSHAKRISDKKSSVPILKHLLFKAEEGGVVLTSTDMEHSLTERLPAVVEQTGESAILAHILSDIVQKIPPHSDLTLTLEEAAQRVVLTTGRSKFEVACLPAEEFPKVYDKDLPHAFELHSEGLKNLLAHTSFAASTEETRYHLQGVYFHSGSGSDATDTGDPSLCAAATDGHRLACYRIPGPEGAEAIPGFILSLKTTEILSKLFESRQQMLKVSLSESQVCFDMEGTHLTARLVDADFPDYQTVIPRDNPIRVSLQTEELKQALERVSAMCDSKASGVMLSFSENELLMTTMDKEYGSADDVLDIEYKGDPIQIGFNHSYLKEIAHKISTCAMFEIGDHTSAIVIKDGEDDKALYVLMPMRL